MWNGTAAILKLKPTASSPTAMSASASPFTRLASAVAMPARFVVPVAPYANAIP